LKKVTIIGNGNIAFAIARGLVESGYQLEVAGRTLEKLEEFENRLGHPITKIPNYLTTGLDISGKDVILAFKPHNLSTSSKSLQGRADTLFSVLAGTTLESLQNHIEAERHIRAMPNISAIYQSSITSLTGDIEAREKAEEIFSKIGEAIWLESEDEVDIATAIAGSGPAFLSLIAEALTDGGVKAGLSRADAEKLVAGLFQSFSPLIEHEKPSLIKDRVMSPKGTTAYGYATLEEKGVRGAVIQAIENSYHRAIELGKK